MTLAEWSAAASPLAAIVGVVVGAALTYLLGGRQMRESEERSRARELRVVLARVQGHTNLLSERVRLGPEMARQKLGWAAGLLDPDNLVPQVWKLFVDEARVDLDDLHARLDLAGYVSPGLLNVSVHGYDPGPVHRYDPPGVVASTLVRLRLHPLRPEWQDPRPLRRGRPGASYGLVLGDVTRDHAR